MSNLYFLNNKKCLYSTYIDDKTYILTCPEKTKIDLLRNTLYHHRSKTNKWLNKGITLKLGDTTNTIDITENDTTYGMNDAVELEFDVTFMNINNKDDVMYLNQLYELANIHLFLIYDYDYLPKNKLLSVHGIMIEKPHDEQLFENYKYLNSIMELDFDDDR